MGAGRGPSVRVEHGDPAGDPVRAILGDLDGRRPGVVPVDLLASLGAVDGETQRSRWAVAYRADDLVHPAAARRHERLGAGAEHRWQPVAAQSGVLADPPVIEDRQLHALVSIALVRHALRVFLVGEPRPGVAAIAERLDRGCAAA